MPKIKYPPRKCKSLDCPNGTFVPRRSDQVFCDSDCRNRYHFMLNKEEETSKYKDVQRLKKIEKTLQRLYKSCKQKGIKSLHTNILLAEDISPDIAISTTKDGKSDRLVHWFFEHGLFMIELNQFKILNKTEYYGTTK